MLIDVDAEGNRGAVAETLVSGVILGCYPPLLWLRKGMSPWVPWVLAPAVLALAACVHPTSAGRTYAAYGGVYVATAIRSPMHDLTPSLLVLTGAAPRVTEPSYNGRPVALLERIS